MSTKTRAVNPMSMQQIRENGLEALARELGVSGMVRFLQQFETGQGDYSTERHQWLDQDEVKARAVEIVRRRQEAKDQETKDKAA